MLHVACSEAYAHPVSGASKNQTRALNGVAVVLTGAEVAQMPGVDPYFGRLFGISQFSRR